MAKKIVKSVFGGKKKAAPAPVNGQPIVTALDGTGMGGGTMHGIGDLRRRKTRQPVSTMGAILSEKLGG